MSSSVPDPADLTAFLREQLAEDERVAQAAFSNQADPENGWGIDGHAITPHVGVIHEDVQRRHVARHDPARVLRDVTAARAILELHSVDVTKTSQYRYDPQTGEPLDAEFEVTCAVCGWASSDPTSACATVRLLAAPFRGAPGWRNEWAIED